MAINSTSGKTSVLSNTPKSIRTAGGIEIPENTIVTKMETAINGLIEKLPLANSAINAGRKFSLWPMPFATACCGIELMAVGASRFDIARFGAEVMRFSPRQCDLLIVAGRVSMKMMPVLQRIWLQMPEPKWSISMGACACTGGVFDTYAVVQGVDRFIPVDSYIPGCPPRPEQILRSLMDMQAKIQAGGSLAGMGLPELSEREKMLNEQRTLPVGASLSQERGDEDRYGYRLPGGAASLGAGRQQIMLVLWGRRPACLEEDFVGQASRLPGIRQARRLPHKGKAADSTRPGPGISMSTASTTASTSHDATLATLRASLGEHGFTTATFRDNLRIYVAADQLLNALKVLKETCGFGLLAELGGTDYLKYPGRSGPRFEVHYALLNLDTHERVVVKVGVDDPDPTLPSAMPIWRGADWMEREVFDMYGIKFEGHPDLRRILMPDEFMAHPLRKDYPLRGRGERHNFPRISRGDS